MASLSRSRTRSKSRSPAPPQWQQQQQPASPRPFLPPAHYAQAAAAAAGSATPTIPTGYPEDHNPKYSTTNGSQRRQSNRMDNVETSLLPSLRDTIDRMTKPPNKPQQRQHQVSDTVTPANVSPALLRQPSSLFERRPSTPSTPNVMLSPSTPIQNSPAVDHLTPKAKPKSALKSALRTPLTTPRIHLASPQPQESTVSSSLKAVKSILGRGKTPTVMTSEVPRPSPRERSRTDPTTKTTAATNAKPPSTPQPTSTAFKSNLPRLQGNRAPPRFALDSSSAPNTEDSDLDYRSEMARRGRRKLVIANANSGSGSGLSSSGVSSSSSASSESELDPESDYERLHNMFRGDGDSSRPRRTLIRETSGQDISNLVSRNKTSGTARFPTPTTRLPMPSATARGRWARGAGDTVSNVEDIRVQQYSGIGLGLGLDAGYNEDDGGGHHDPDNGKYDYQLQDQQPPYDLDDESVYDDDFGDNDQNYVVRKSDDDHARNCEVQSKRHQALLGLVNNLDLTTNSSSTAFRPSQSGDGMDSDYCGQPGLAISGSGDVVDDEERRRQNQRVREEQDFPYREYQAQERPEEGGRRASIYHDNTLSHRSSMPALPKSNTDRQQRGRPAAVADPTTVIPDSFNVSIDRPRSRSTAASTAGVLATSSSPAHPPSVPFHNPSGNKSNRHSIHPRLGFGANDHPQRPSHNSSANTISGNYRRESMPSSKHQQEPPKSNGDDAHSNRHSMYFASHDATAPSRTPRISSPLPPLIPATIPPTSTSVNAHIPKRQSMHAGLNSRPAGNQTRNEDNKPPPTPRLPSQDSKCHNTTRFIPPEPTPASPALSTQFQSDEVSAAARERRAFGIPPSESDEMYYSRRATGATEQTTEDVGMNTRPSDNSLTTISSSVSGSSSVGSSREDLRRVSGFVDGDSSGGGRRSFDGYGSRQAEFEGFSVGAEALFRRISGKDTTATSHGRRSANLSRTSSSSARGDHNLHTDDDDGGFEPQDDSVHGSRGRTHHGGMSATSSASSIYDERDSAVAPWVQHDIHSAAPVSVSVPQLSPPPSPPKHQLLTEVEQARQQAVHSLIDSEEEFVRRLHRVSSLFVLPLRVQDSKTQWITGVPAGIARLFDWLDDILVLHSQMLETLQGLKPLRDARDATVVEHIGGSLRVYIPRLEVYQPYLVKLASVSRTLELLCEQGSESDFGEFIKMQEDSMAKDDDSDGWSLREFLLEPANRLGRYTMLFQRILDLTPKSHSDYLDMLTIVKATEMAIRVMTEVKMLEDEYEAMKSLLSRIRGLPDAHQIPRRDRKLLLQGVVYMHFCQDESTSRNTPAEDVSTSVAETRRAGLKRSSTLVDAIQDWDARRERSGSIATTSTTSSTGYPVSPTPAKFSTRGMALSMTTAVPLSNFQPSTPIRTASKSASDNSQNRLTDSTLVNVFVFTDLIIIATPLENSPQEWNLYRRPGRDDSDTDLGVSRVISMSCREQDLIIELDLVPVDPYDLNNSLITTGAVITTVELRCSSTSDSTLEDWIGAFAHTNQAVLRSLSTSISSTEPLHDFRSDSQTHPKSTPRICHGQVELDFDTQQSMMSILASGLPLPKSPSLQLEEEKSSANDSHQRTHGNSDAQRQEREERGWWSLRYQQILREIQRRDTH